MPELTTVFKTKHVYKIKMFISVSNILTREFKVKDEKSKPVRYDFL